MRNYAVIGDPVAHSRSPGMQNAAFRHHRREEIYLKYHVKPEELTAFVAYARGALAGFNCTVPHKEAILKHLDEVTTDATLARSVNTVTVRSDGTLAGDSTDGYGLAAALRESFSRDIAGAEICFIGAGGAAQATAFHLARLGAKAIRIANRTEAKAAELAERLAAALPGLTVEAASNRDHNALRRWFGTADFLIQATSLGLHTGDEAPFSLNLLEPGMKLAVFDTIYLPTPLLADAQSKGLSHAGGAAMLLHQGARSFEIWTGLTAPVELMRQGMLEKPGPVDPLALGNAR